MKEIQVVITMGGYGYNLFPFTERTPKQLLSVANKPFLAYLLDQFIFLCNQENKEKIENYVRNKFKWPNKKQKYNLVFYSPEHYDADSKLIASIYKQKILTKDFLLVNAENLCSVNLNQLIDYHYVNDSDITSCFNKNIRSQQLLVVEQQNDKIMKFIDKEQLQFDKIINFSEACVSNNKQMEILRNYEMSGIHLCNIKVAKIITKVQQKFYEFEDEILPFIIDNQYNRQLIQEYNEVCSNDINIHKFNSQRTIQNQNNEESINNLKPLQIKAFLFNGIFDQITNIQEYQALNQKAIAYQRNQKIYYHTDNNQSVQEIDKKQKNVKFSIIAKGCFLSDNCKIERSVLGQNCRIDDSNITNCTLMDKVIIEKDVTLENCLIGSEVFISSGMTLKNCILGDNFRVEKNDTMVMEDEKLSILDNPVEFIQRYKMNDLDQLINFCKEFLVNKKQNDINENIYHNLTEVSERFVLLIIQEYKKIFNLIKCEQEMKQKLQNYNQSLKKYLKVINMNLQKQSNTMKNQLLDSISIDEVDKFWNYDLQNLLNSILCLEVNYKEFLELEHKMGNSIFQYNNYLQVNNSNPQQNFMVRLQKHFCEELIENFEELNLKMNQENVKEFFQKKNFQIYYKIEQFLQVVESNQYVQYLWQRRTLTFEILNDLNKIKLISCSLYGDKIMKCEELSEFKKKKFSFTENKLISFTKTKTAKNMSICLSKVRGNNHSQDMNSLAEEINLLLKERKDSQLINKYSKIEYYDLDEEEDDISKIEENSQKDFHKKKDVIIHKGFCSYCIIF